MKYFRVYPWGLQLMLFLLMALTFMSAAGVIYPSVFTRLTGYLPTQLESIGPQSPGRLVHVAVVTQGLLNCVIFMLPPAVFAYLAHPRPMAYLGLRKPAKNIHLLLSVLVILGAMPLLQLLENVMSHFNFGNSVKVAQEANDNMMTAFLNMPSVGRFLQVFVLLAIIPAVGEELFFRSMMMRFAHKIFRGMTIPIIFTAAIFAYSHSNIYGLPSIFLAGILLAVIYNLTGSLWCNILAHMFFNGLQIILAYMSNNMPGLKSFLSASSIPMWLVGSGAILFGISFYLLYRLRTPLPRNWTDDFTLQELSENAY